MLGVTSSLPGWTPHPDVWLVVAFMAVGYWMTVERVGRRIVSPGTPVVTRAQVVAWSLGCFTIWLSSDWPVHDIAEQSMYSVHMVQHMMITTISVPLFLLGTPAWMARWFLGPGSRRFAVVRFCSKFLPAVIVFNVMLALTHIPGLVNASAEDGLLHFSLHTAMFLTAFVVWMPVLSPLPEIPRLGWLLRMVYLFLQMIIPTVPASFLTLGDQPLYKHYVGLPHLWGMNTLEDMQVAGLIMKIGAGLYTSALIAVIFFRWAADEERRQRPQVRRALERELEQMSTTP